MALMLNFQHFSPVGEYRNISQLKPLSTPCFLLGFASIIGSIAIWFLASGVGPEAQAHAERFGIFEGL